MATAGEEGLAHYDLLHGRQEPVPAPWACTICDTAQVNRQPYFVDGRATCSFCFWRSHEDQAG